MTGCLYRLDFITLNVVSGKAYRQRIINCIYLQARNSTFTASEIDIHRKNFHGNDIWGKIVQSFLNATTEPQRTLFDVFVRL